MPLPGGASDKIPNRYELKWTVRCMLDVLAGRATRIWLEPPGAAGEGIEFIVRTPEGDFCHQVKRQHTRGSWSLSLLESVGVLSAFLKHLGSGRGCEFISTVAAYELQELTKRARDSASFEEYDSVFLGSKGQRDHFDHLRKAWGKPPATEVYDLLKRVHVKTIDEDSLLHLVHTRIEQLMTGAPADVADKLMVLALESVHAELTAEKIWSHLRARGHVPRGWNGDIELRQRLDDMTRETLQAIEGSGISGEILLRDEEVSTVMEKMNQGRCVLLSGEAGVGKSGVLAQVVKRAQEHLWPVLVLRADRSISSSDSASQGLHQPLPGSPAAVLTGLAGGGDALLVIDQLDAVSTASGRNPERFDSYMAILRQARNYDKLRVLLACRQFDIDNDERLRELATEKGTACIIVESLSESARNEALKRVGIPAETLSPTLGNLLRSPLHLKLYIGLVQSGAPGMLQVRNLNDLYDRYWKVKEETIRHRLQAPSDWTRVIDTLCEVMTERQELSVPLSRLDRYEATWKAMASEGVLSIDGKQARFFHETLFDYAFARRFAGEGRSLESLLMKGRQELFLRAQVRQILVYQRSEDRAGYLENLRFLLESDSIRLHLKLIALATACSFEAPTPEEWALVAPFAENPPDVRGRTVWATLARSAAWFECADSEGAWRRWLSSSHEKLCFAAFTSLIDAYPHSKSRVLEILRIFAGRVLQWNEHLDHFVSSHSKQIHDDDNALEFLLQQVDAGSFDGANSFERYEVERILPLLEIRQPTWVSRALGLWLKRIMSDQPQHALRLLSKKTISTAELLEEPARKCPADFVESVFDFVITMPGSNSTSEPDQDDSMWLRRRLRQRSDSFGSALLKNLETALHCLAKESPTQCAPYIVRLLAYNLEVTPYLIASAYMGNPIFFADEAVRWLCTVPAALELAEEGSPRWISRGLIKSVTPHCSPAALERLASVLLHFVPEWERSASALQARGSAQLELLSAINPERQNHEVKRRIEELERKLGKPEERISPRVRSDYVHSPIPYARASKMSDEHWLQAMNVYGPGVDYNPKRGMFAGGTLELARVLEELTEKQPERFARLCLQMPEGTAIEYIKSVLQGLRKANLQIDLLVNVFRRAHASRGSRIGICLSEFLMNHSELTLPEEILQRLSQYATEDPDPSQDLWKIQAKGGQLYYNGEIDSFAINCTRGRAAMAIGEFLRAMPQRLPFFLPALERLVRDPILAVRAAAIRALLFVIEPDAQCAVRLFLTAVDSSEEILASENVELFIRYSARRHYAQVEPVIMRMMNSSIPTAMVAGAKQLTLVSLDRDELDPIVDRCLAGSVEQRLGVAEICSVNVIKSPRQDRTTALLTRLFHDGDKAVRDQALRCFNELESAPLERYGLLFDALAESPVPTSDALFPLKVLAKGKFKLPLSTLKFCENHLERMATKSRFDSRFLTTLVLRLYAQYRDPAIRARCLDLIDRMCHHRPERGPVPPISPGTRGPPQQ